MKRVRSVRHRLLLIAILPMVVILPMIVGVLIYKWDKRFDELLSAKVGSDLKIAGQYMNQLLSNDRASLTAIADSESFHSAVGGDRGALSTLLASKARPGALDFIALLDRDGHLLASSEPSSKKAVLLKWPVIEKAVNGVSDVQVAVVQGDDLRALSPQLAARAEIVRLPEPGEQSPPSTYERRALMIQAATPVNLPGQQPGVLVAGTLLNHNTHFIDQITDLIYRDNGMRSGSAGIASLFLGDTRISTNAKLPGGRPASGTRASAEVAAAVLGQGRTWLAKAFVVNDWYISGYMPIRDSQGVPIGMLFVGFSDEPFATARRTAIGMIVLGCLLVAAITVPLFLYIARGVFRPLEKMDAAISRVKAGDRNARAGTRGSNDEIGRLASQLDQMLNQLQDNERQLVAWNEELNTRVEERTAGLLLANRQLEEATQHLIVKEKLATIGEIAAGVAHEINNPLAVMQGNLELLREAVLQDSGPGGKEEFDLIEDQIQRISTIVSKLLQFSKPSEHAAEHELLEPSSLLLETLPLVQHLTKRQPVMVEKRFHSTRLIRANRGEIQQILVNIMINALHAMPGGGVLGLATEDTDDIHGAPGVGLRISDTGGGIPQDILERVFEPFFTTKHHQGTGLGLSISQMLASRHRGSLSVASTGPAGTVVELWMPEAAEDRPSALNSSNDMNEWRLE